MPKVQKKLRMLCELLGTVAGWRGFVELCRLVAYHGLCRWIRWPHSGRMFPVHIRSLNGGRVYCRVGTCDIGVLHATFVKQYHVPPDDLRGVQTIIDLGSNIGLTVAHYACLFPNARILGIELDADNLRVCRKNIAAYGDRCEVLHGAAWFQSGAVSYTAEQRDGSLVSAAGYHIALEREQIKGTVPAYTISTLIQKLGPPLVDFVKIDIEGAEQPVLVAGKGWVPAIRCLKVEIHEPYTLRECISVLERFGLNCQIDQRHPACVVARNLAAW